MYKIAICDDDKRYRKTIREIVEHENSLHENEIRFYEYESGNELLKHTDILHELVFIDIRMPGLDGNQTALKLRNYNKDAVLIFCSSYFEPTVDSINFGQPFRYIMKDLHDTSLRREIAAIMTEVKRRFLNDYAVTVTSAGKIIRIHVENILYVSRAKRGCVITIVKEQEKETVRCRESFGELCEQLKDQGFAQAHYSYIVNLGKVERIHVVVGDASIPKFGLEEETYEILRSKVDCIFNCAAIVSHLGLYEVMYKSNVLTCSNILKFAEKKKNIKIFHISTKHVGFGSVPDKKEVLFSESEFNVGQVIDNNYAKTKYEAETLMRAARDEGYNINIFRMGNISCELKGGKFQKNIEQNAFYILTRSFLRLGILPLSEQKTVDLTYVDSAARAIYLLATRKNLNNETYHIENTELLSFTHMGKMIQKYGENVVLRPYEDMWDYFLPIYEEGTDNSKMQEINNLIAYIDFLPWHMPTMFRFVKDKTKILLEKMGFAWKEPDQEIIDNLLDYGKQVGFFD